MSGKTLFEKIWARHEVVAETESTPAVLYIDLHLTHEVTTPQAFTFLRERQLPVRRPDLTFGTLDHSTPTLADELYGRVPMRYRDAEKQVQQFVKNCQEFQVPLLDVHHPDRGIVHVIGPELGLTQPGKTIVCGDSHTSTHGAFGALAFGIGTTEVGHVLATQCLLQRKPKTMLIQVDGQLGPHVTAKDLILAIIQRIGIGGGTGCVIEYRGPAISALSMDERMTVCNMSIEAGARAGLIAPDEKTAAYLKGLPHAPQGPRWEQALADWQQLYSDDDARFDHTVVIDASAIKPMITYGTNPEMSVAIDEAIPHKPGNRIFEQSLSYMGFTPGQTLVGQPIQFVFIGSCTNGRLSDLQAAAEVFKQRRVAPGVTALVVPGSMRVKRAAEQLGLDQIFINAGAQWREAGCSMCLGMNGDTVPAQQWCVSTSNRNFEGRQGKGARTLLASPVMAALAAVHGHLTDPRGV
jgi:3-isopropylmalate/(R)-2-methylmalate dehydratase large subunit